MTIVNKFEALISLNARGKFGYSKLYGTAFFGASLFGFDSPYPGIYQQKVTVKGKKTSRMIHYWPSNPRTVQQQAWRDVFKSGKTAWDSLTTDQKKLYNKRGHKIKLTGYNLFMREWLSSHR
jgi:hypothetical protein